MTSNFVYLIHAATGQEISVNVQRIRYLSQFDPQTV